LLYFELALFGLFAAAILFCARSRGSPRRFDLAWSAVHRPSFNPGAIEDHVAAFDFDAAGRRVAVHNALAQYGAARRLLDALDVDTAVDDAIFNRGVICRILSLPPKPDGYCWRSPGAAPLALVGQAGLT
jgi:hypothetical protein